jgi:hypothetical protein
VRRTSSGTGSRRGRDRVGMDNELVPSPLPKDTKSVEVKALSIKGPTTKPKSY